MKTLTAIDCLCPRVKRVLEEERPPRSVPEDVHYAVFSGNTRTGVFQGLASLRDQALHPDWIFADLAEHRPLEGVSADAPLRKVLAIMHRTRREALPVLDAEGYFVGAVSSRSLLEGLLRQERVLLVETRRLYRLAEGERRELARWSQRLTRLHETSRTLLNVLAHTAIEEEVLQAGIEALTGLIEAKYGAIGILNAEGGLAHFVHTGMSEAAAKKIDHLPEGRGLLGLVIQENMPIRLENMRTHPQSAGFPPGHPVMTSLLAVPISHAGHVYGRIYLSDKKSGEPFSEADELLAMSFAHSLSLVLDNVREIEEIRHAREALDYLAHFDTLTGLPNRELVTDRVRQALAHAHRSAGKVAMLFIDLDNFKHVNDSYGHATGDALLKAVATRLQACVREGDTVARLSGDEFLIMLSDIEDAQDAATVAQKILETLALPYPLEEHEIFSGASIGISIFPVDGDSMEEMLRTADTAMYHAKTSGRNGYQFFTNSMNIASRRFVALERGLRRALEHHELVLHYQPQVELREGRIVGMEALLRWQSAEFGMVSPAEFIPVAEDAGLIVAIGAWVLETACRQAKQWLDAGYPHLCVAVNLSARQFRDRHFIDHLERTLSETGLPTHMLELELTESIMIEDTDAVMKILARIKAMGIRISIDDFGTGYSSLSYLRRFPIGMLKIDQSFVRIVPHDADGAAIVRAIIHMAHGLRLNVIAEGVETPEQLAFLLHHGCDEIQGYLFSKPLTVDEMSAWLHADKRLAVSEETRIHYQQ
jgi:diguanylate cyclase (GGDEF)-like protein